MLAEDVVAVVVAMPVAESQRLRKSWMLRCRITLTLTPREILRWRQMVERVETLVTLEWTMKLWYANFSPTFLIIGGTIDR
jgi:hypothetical protein